MAASAAWQHGASGAGIPNAVWDFDQKPGRGTPGLLIRTRWNTTCTCHQEGRPPGTATTVTTNPCRAIQ
ncbi:hypothetical protein GCM10027072_17380 [Streptomyces bullii]